MQWTARLSGLASAYTEIVMSTHSHVGSRLNNPVGVRDGNVRASDLNYIIQGRLAPPYGTDWSRLNAKLVYEGGQKRR
jgi:hypothetical protein